jgi:hypothetical protein
MCLACEEVLANNSIGLSKMQRHLGHKYKEREFFRAKFNTGNPLAFSNVRWVDPISNAKFAFEIGIWYLKFWI